MLNKEGRKFSETDLIEHLSEADGVIIGLDPFTSRVIDALPRLKVISKFGVGLDNVDVEHALKKNIPVAFKSGVNRRSASELTLAFMIGLSRNVFQSGYLLKNGTIMWNYKGGKWNLVISD